MNKEHRLVFNDQLGKKFEDAWDEDVFNTNIESSKKASKDKRKNLKSPADDLLEEQEKDEANAKNYIDKTLSYQKRINALNTIMGKDRNKIEYQNMLYLRKNNNFYYSINKGKKYYEVNEKNINALGDYHELMNRPQEITKAKLKNVLDKLTG